MNRIRRGIAGDAVWLLRFFREALFPRLCAGCGREGEWFCPSCRVSLSAASPLCPVCWQESRSGERHASCGRNEDPSGVLCLWEREGAARRGVEVLRRQGIAGVAADLIRFRLEEIAEDSARYDPFLAFLARKPSVGFVPMHRSASRRQGFDHAETAARVLSRAFKLPFVSVLEKREARGSQLDLAPLERTERPKGAFIVKRGVRVPSHVLLVDDVWGTGATMRECSAVLADGGAEDLWGVALVRGM